MDFFLAPDPSEGAFGPEEKHAWFFCQTVWVLGVLLLVEVVGLCSLFVVVVLGSELK